MHKSGVVAAIFLLYRHIQRRKLINKESKKRKRTARAILREQEEVGKCQFWRIFIITCLSSEEELALQINRL